MDEEKKPGGFQKWLYRNYRQGSALGSFIRQRVLPGAWLLMGGGIISVLLGGNFDKSIVVVLTFLMLGVLSVGFVWSFFRGGLISAVRQMPATGVAGQLLRYQVRVRNEGKSKLREAFLREAGDDPRPTEWEFLHLKEPGEDERNLFDRVFGFYRWKWLQDRGGRWKATDRSTSLELKAREEAMVLMSIMPKKRGVLVLEDLRLELSDPFGLFQRRRPTLNERAEVLVLPKRYRLPPFELGGRSELRVGGETASTVRGDGGEFLGLREYRAGDSLRKIYWKGWARTGQAVVKEDEEVRFPRYGLILDTSLHDSNPDWLEEAISVAASFVGTVERENCLLDLMFVGDEPEVFTAGRGVAKPDRLMEVLARVEGSEDGGYDSLQRLILGHADELTAGVVVFSGWNEERKEFLARLRSFGLELKVFALGSGEAADDAIAAGVGWLRYDHVQRDLMKA